MATFIRTLSVILVAAAVTFMVQTAHGADCGDGVGPCSCGDRVVTNTKLDGSDPVLNTRCPCHGLIVDPAVTLLEINGTIQGSGIVAGENVCSGILVPFSTGVVVRIGRLVDFGLGVNAGDFFAAGGVTGGRFSRLQIVDSLVGIFLGGDDNVIESNNVVIGARVPTVGIALNGARNVVSLNRFEGHAVGIEVAGSRNVVSRNFGLRNLQECIVVFGDNSTVDRNRCVYGGQGFTILGANHTVTLNLAEGNESDGFGVAAESTTFSRNRSNYNSGVGIFDFTQGSGTGGTANTYTDNRCTGNDLGNSFLSGLCF